MFCPRCGQNLPDGSGFCIRCGMPLFQYQSGGQGSPPPKITDGPSNGNVLVGPQANPWVPDSRNRPQLGPGGHYYINGMPVDVFSEQGPTYQPLRPDEKVIQEAPVKTTSVFESLQQQSMEEIEDDGVVPIQGMENPYRKRYKTQEDVETDSEFSKFKDELYSGIPLWPLRLIVSILSLFVTGFLVIQTLGYHTLHMIVRGTFDNIIGLEIVFVAVANLVSGLLGFFSRKSRGICIAVTVFYIIVATMSFLFRGKYPFMMITFVLSLIAAVVFILGSFGVGSSRHYRIAP